MSTFIQGNVSHYIQELEKMTMDQADLQVRHTKLEVDHKALLARYALLESQAAALVWSVPDDVKVGDLQNLAHEFRALKAKAQLDAAATEGS